MLFFLLYIHWGLLYFSKSNQTSGSGGSIIEGHALGGRFCIYFWYLCCSSSSGLEDGVPDVLFPLITFRIVIMVKKGIV